MKVGNIIAASAIVATLGLPLCEVAVADALTDLVDSYYDQLDRYQDKIIESNRAVNDAMNEGETRRPPPDQATGPYFLERYNHYDRLYKINDALLRSQQELLNKGLKLLLDPKLPQNKRAEIQTKFDLVTDQRKGTIKARNDYLTKRNEFDELIQDYKRKTGSYPPHNCVSAAGWHLPAGAKCNGSSTNSHTDTGDHGH